MKKTLQAVFAASAMLVALHASATTIDFDNLAVGTTLSNQYAGVTFAANAFTGPGTSSSGEDWATNTDMTIVSSTGTDVGGLGAPSLVSGNLLRSFAGWLNENGDPSFSVSFTSAINFFSADFAGVATPADVRIYAYNGNTLLGSSVSAVTTGQFTLSFAAASITRVVVTPGSFNDWVGVDNINYTTAVAAIPEPETYALMGLGLVALAFARRRASKRA